MAQPTAVTILDGPMGTELAARGVDLTGREPAGTPASAWSAYALDARPDVVRAIHEDYARAGAEVHRANTFRTQPRMFPDRFPGRFRALARLAVRLAREAVPEGARVAGSIAPFEDCYRPDLFPGADVARSCHRAVAGALAEAGVDLALCETFPHPGEAVLAVEEAVRTGLPTWIALTAGPDGSLMTPERMERAARDCVSAGASAVLVNCTAATRTLAYVERLANVGVPFGAYANAGEASEGLGWASPVRAPERYLALAETWLARGATIVGSCCGTSPAHINAIRRRLRG